MPSATPVGCQDIDDDAMPSATPVGCQDIDDDAMPLATPVGCHSQDVDDAKSPVDPQEFETTPQQPSEYQKLNPRCHLPVCWDDAKYEAFRAKHPWLVAQEGGLLCNICSKVGKLHLAVVMTKGIYIRPEWVSLAVFPSGDTKQAQLASLRNKIKRHKASISHQRAEECLEKTNKNEIGSAVLKSALKNTIVTEKVFRTVYYLVKQNRPFSDHVKLCELQILNGVDLGFGLHSRYSATEILSSIASSMRSELCSAIISGNCKISLMLDESTTVSHKSALILYLRTFMYSENKSTEAFAFPLELIELECLSAESITNTVLSTLHKHTFTKAYLKKNLVGVCADGASTMVGKKSGVTTRLQEIFPNIIIWHCMCHRLELAVGDAVDSVTEVNHIKLFIDKLYSLYHTSPKARRKLEECAKELETQVMQMKRVLDTRWTPSSFRALQAVWNNYEALHKHFTDESNTGKANAETATYRGLKATLETDAFIHALTVMLDAISEISELSLVLQSESTTIVKAYQALKRTIRALAQQKDQDGDNELSERTYYPHFRQYIAAMQDNCFKGVTIQQGRRRQPKLDKNAFLQALIDNLLSRLECNVASQRSGVDSTGGASFREYKSLIRQIDTINPEKWPSDVESPWIAGEQQLKSLCERLQLPFEYTKRAFRDYIDDPLVVPNHVNMLKKTIDTLPVTSADCERGFSQMNLIDSKLRNKLTVQHVSDLIFVSLVGPPLSKFRPEKYVKKWIKHHRTANDNRTRVATVKNKTRYQAIWDLF